MNLSFILIFYFLHKIIFEEIYAHLSLTLCIDFHFHEAQLGQVWVRMKANQLSVSGFEERKFRSLSA